MKASEAVFPPKTCSHLPGFPASICVKFVCIEKTTEAQDSFTPDPQEDRGDIGMSYTVGKLRKRADCLAHL